MYRFLHLSVGILLRMKTGTLGNRVFFFGLSPIYRNPKFNTQTYRVSKATEFCVSARFILYIVDGVIDKNKKGSCERVRIMRTTCQINYRFIRRSPDMAVHVRGTQKINERLSCSRMKSKNIAANLRDVLFAIFCSTTVVLFSYTLKNEIYFSTI